MPKMSGIFRGSNGRFALILMLLVLAGGYLRTHSLGSQPYWMDEGYTLIATTAILEHGSTVLDSGFPYSCPTYCYPSAAFANIFGAGAVSYRLLAALAGIASIVAVFFVARALFEQNAALFASFFTAFSYYQIAWSRQARWYTLFELFFLLALFFFYRTMYGESRRSRAVFALLCAAATALAIFTHGLGVLLLGVFALWLLIDALFIRKAASRIALSLAILTGGGALALLGMLPFGVLRFYWTGPYYIAFYLFAYFLPLILALVALLSGRRERAVWFLALGIAAYAIPLITLTEVVHYRYFFHLAPLLFILAGVGAEYLRTCASSGAARALITALVILLFVTTGGVWKPQSFYFLESDDPAKLPGLPYWAYTPQPDWNAAYAYIASHRAQGDIVISSMPQFNKIFLHEPGYWYKYDYYRSGDTERYVRNGRDIYVGASVINDLNELEALAASHHGFIVYDYMATDGRIPAETLNYIESHF
ncbi:MAG: hypothetical protein RLZZ416_518, partial [Candidatus Parcubacteria bacterium]